MTDKPLGLPVPPTDHEKIEYVYQNKWLIYGWAFFSFVCLIAGMSLFMRVNLLALGFAPFVVLNFVYLSLSYFIGILGRPFDLNKHTIRKNYWIYRYFLSERIAILPKIDVYLPSCGEPIEVLKNTLKWSRSLKWEEGKLQFYVLDDSDRREVALLADRYEMHYISRPNRGELKKAGNIRYAFPRTFGDFILILDADFAPRADMLYEMMPYFEDERCAIVQSPQYFTIEKCQSWVQKGAAYIQELFYRMVQVHRDRWKASICVGTCALYRRKALEPHGGTYPIEYSEDMHTGWQVTIDGWYVKYIPLNLAKGLCPETMAGFFVQQTRWCTGSVGLMLSKKFWINRLPLMTRVCYLSGQLYYIATAFAVVFGALPSLAVVWFWPRHVFWYNFLWSFPSFLMGVVIMNYWSRAPWGIYVMQTRQVSYYAHCFALWNKFRGTISEWIPSGDNAGTRKASDYGKFKTALFFWTSIITFLSISGAFYSMTDLHDLNFYPILFFSSLNYMVCMLCLKEEA